MAIISKRSSGVHTRNPTATDTQTTEVRTDTGKCIERSISQLEDRYQLQSDGFKKLIPTGPTQNGGKLASPSSSKRALNARQKFYNNLNFVPDNKQFSILSCIQSLPEKITDWPEGKYFDILFVSFLTKVFCSVRGPQRQQDSTRVRIYWLRLKMSSVLASKWS